MDVPKQLPAAPRHFVGRDAELAELTRDLDGTGTVLISALAGAGGIGKTALALWWAYRNLHRFPDGQLFVDLQGFSPAGKPVAPAAAVRGFLSALGTDPAQVPVDPQSQAALYRSRVAGRRMLVVLDNVADTAQVVPLLPGSPTCTVLVTSRRHLTGLVSRHGARHLPLGVLDAEDARALLVARIGAARTSAEPAAVEELLDSCGGFALALNVVAGRAIMNPATPLADLAAELRDVATLDDEEPAASLPSVLSWSMHTLTEEQATAFALLGIAPGADLGLPAATHLIGPAARRLLRVLTESSLVTGDAGRYAMHNLVRGYAHDRAAALPPTDRATALRRVTDFYLHTAYAADRLFYPYRPPIQLAPPLPGTVPEALPDAAAALTWFDRERANLLATVRTAADHGWSEQVWQLAWAVTMFLARQGHLEDCVAAWRVVLTVVDQVPDPAIRILIHRNVGRAYAEAKQPDDASDHLYRALALAERHDDVAEQAYVHANLLWAWEVRGDFRKALEHGLRSLFFRRAIGDEVGEANARHAVGWCAARLGDHDRAREHSTAALELHRVQQHVHGQAVALSTLGFVDLRTGRPHEAVRHYEAAVALFHECGNAFDAAEAMEHLGDCYAGAGEPDKARTTWQDARDLYRRQGRDLQADDLQRRLES